MLSIFFGMLLQDLFNISEVSARQVILDTLVFFWCIKSFFSYKTIKPMMLNKILSGMQEDISLKKYSSLLVRIIRLSIFQTLCFSSIHAVNFLSGFSLLSFLDWVGLIIALTGLSLEIYCEKQIKVTKKAHLIESGPWSKFRHPNIYGIMLFFLGIQILALGAVGSEWSLLGFLLLCYILHSIVMPELDKKLLTKFKAR